MSTTATPPCWPPGIWAGSDRCVNLLQNDPRVTKLVGLLRSPEVKKFIEDKYQGSVIAAF